MCDAIRRGGREAREATVHAHTPSLMQPVARRSAAHRKKLPSAVRDCSNVNAAASILNCFHALVFQTPNDGSFFFDGGINRRQRGAGHGIKTPCPRNPDARLPPKQSAQKMCPNTHLPRFFKSRVLGRARPAGQKQLYKFHPLFVYIRTAQNAGKQSGYFPQRG